MFSFEFGKRPYCDKITKYAKREFGCLFSLFDIPKLMKFSRSKISLIVYYYSCQYNLIEKMESSPDERF